MKITKNEGLHLGYAFLRYCFCCRHFSCAGHGGQRHHRLCGRSSDRGTIVITGQRIIDSSDTATKTDTPLIETPQSISTISASQLQAQGVQSLGEALRYSAGVNAEEYGGLDSRLDQYMIRGFQTSMPYVDGLTTQSRYTLLSAKVYPYGAQSIEVLRGPSSVLYGQNVPGGLVNVVSKRPQDVASGEVGLQTGSYGRIEGHADITGPLTSDGTLLYRLTGEVLSSGTQIHHVDQHHYFVAPSLSWQPDAQTSVTVLSHFVRQNDGYAWQSLPAEGTLQSAPFGKIPTSLFTGEKALNFATLTQWDIGYNAQHSFSSDWTIHQNLRFSRAEVGLGYVAGSGLQTDEGGNATSIMDRYALKAHAQQKNFAVDTNLEGRFMTGPVQHTLLVGLDYSHAYDHWKEWDGSADPLDLTDPVHSDNISLDLDFITRDTLDQVGLYGQDQMKIGKLSLVGSVREDWARTRTTENDKYSVSNLLQKNDALTGRIGAVYQFDNGLAPYVSYSTSFQPTIGTTYDGSAMKPTTAKQWEGGVKFQPKGSRSFVTASVYSIRERNVTTADPDHDNFEIQTGGVRVQGLELSGDLDLGHGLTANAAYAHMDSKITKSNDGDVGNRMEDVPRDSGSLWLDERLLVRDAQHLNLGAGVRYMGPRYGDTANSLRIPASTQFDAMIGYDIGRWSIVLNIQNLTDKTSVATCTSASRCFYNDRRSILGSLNYRW
ncbi:TonB-dependent siderophore receptor [Novosphingobium sp. 9]|uniref:TonB-dependent siderophore receptor n=1 Tax=Novosphingobium sp. 9 TaxID=2025349 RepID=UPI0021B5F92C|nr:TonB-dependent siderophore receptor [Novosphingobium sp. 9]